MQELKDSHTQLILDFERPERPELIETNFCHPLVQEELRTIRGRTPGAYHRYGSFQWTRAIKGLCVLMLLECAHGESQQGPLRSPALSGGRGTPAASLNDALHKQVAWLIDMFGIDYQGIPLARRLIDRSNPGMKRPGVVALALNQSFLPVARINIRLEGCNIKETEQFSTMAKQIEQDYYGIVTMREVGNG